VVFKLPKTSFITKTVECSEGKSAQVRMHNLVTGRNDMNKEEKEGESYY
jgi:hypothetical protein